MPERSRLDPRLIDKQALVDLVMSRYEFSRDAFTTFHLRSARLYNAYRTWTQGRFQRHRNYVPLPLLFSMVWADVARKVNTSFATNQIVDAFGYGPEDRPVTEKNKILLNAQFKDMGMFRKAVNIISSGDMYGAGISMLGWQYEEQDVVKRRQQAIPITGELVESLETERRVMFDGPNTRYVDVIDWFPQPNVPNPEDLGWAVVKYTLDFDEFEVLVEQGIFDRSALEEIRFTNEVEDQSARLGLAEASDLRHGNEHMARIKEKFARPVTIFEYWGTVPREFAQASPDERGSVHRVLSVANGRVLARNRINPYAHGRLPFHVHRPLPDLHFLYGPSKIEMAERLQWLGSRFASQKADSLDLFGDPSFYLYSAANVDTRNLFTAPGRIFEGDVPANEAIQPITPDLRGLAGIDQEIAFLNEMLQRTTGIIDDVQGISSGPRETARAFVGRQENVSIRLLLESRVLEETWLEPLARDMIQLNRQFLQTPREVRILGGNMFDPLSGQQLTPEQARIEADDLNLDYDVRALGATQALPKAVKQQNWVLLTQQIHSNPFWLAMMNQEAFLRETLRLFEVTDVDQFLNVPPKQQVLMAQLNQAGMLGNAREPRAESPAQVGDATQLPPLGGLEGLNVGLGA